MAAINFDAIDLKLLSELQENGRITNVELASKVGLTAPPCLRRMRTPEQHRSRLAGSTPGQRLYRRRMGRGCVAPQSDAGNAGHGS